MFDQVLNYHRFMLAEKNRVKSYQKAIEEVVKEGDVVVDIGTGSGLLSFFSVLAGAKKVYAIEQNEIIEEAKMLSKINGFDDKIVFIKGRSDKIELPEKVDVIVSEIIGHFGIDENIIKFISDAKKRFLKKDGKIIPDNLDLYVVPIESGEIWYQYAGLWNKDFYGIDLSPIKEKATSQQYVLDCRGKINELSFPEILYSFNLYKDESLPSQFTGEFKINKNGNFHGYMGYFMSSLSENISICSGPGELRNNWDQTFLPLKDSVEVLSGDKVNFDLKGISFEGALFWEWDTRVSRDGEIFVKFNQGNRDVVKEELLYGMKKFIPIFNNHGNLTKKVFTLIDGNRSADDIAKMIMNDYPEKYAYFEMALQDVLQVIQGCVNLKLADIKGYAPLGEEE